MEQREILVANTKTQKKYKVITDATTLGELKLALSEAGIDYSGMTFTEGISKTQLIDDATQLPHDILYKGQPTNNLAILLTNTKKNIASGAMSRNEVYQAIKDNNLQDAVKKEFGRNFTQVPTHDLIGCLMRNNCLTPTEEDPQETETPVEEKVETSSTEAEEDIKESDNKEEVEETNEPSCTVGDVIADTDIADLEDSLFLHIAMLVQYKALDKGDIQALINNLQWLSECMDAKTFSTPKSAPVSSSDGSISEDDIDDMINELGI